MRISLFLNLRDLFEELLYLQAIRDKRPLDDSRGRIFS